MSQSRPPVNPDSLAQIQADIAQALASCAFHMEAKAEKDDTLRIAKQKEDTTRQTLKRRKRATQAAERAVHEVTEAIQAEKDKFKELSEKWQKLTGGGDSGASVAHSTTLRDRNSSSAQQVDVDDHLSTRPVPSGSSRAKTKASSSANEGPPRKRAKVDTNSERPSSSGPTARKSIGSAKPSPRRNPSRGGNKSKSDEFPFGPSAVDLQSNDSDSDFEPGG